MRPNPLDLPDFDYVVTRPDGRGFDLVADCLCERCDGPMLVPTGVTVSRVPRGAKRLDAVLPCDCPTWRDHAVTVGKAVGFVAAGVAAYVFVCALMLL